jgi:hypothetical protein
MISFRPDYIELFNDVDAIICSLQKLNGIILKLFCHRWMGMANFHPTYDSVEVPLNRIPNVLSGKSNTLSMINFIKKGKYYTY